MKTKLLILLFIGFTVSLFAQDAKENEADKVMGVWLTESGKAKVEITKEDDKYVGKIVWLKEPLDENGNPKLDKENPEEELRERQLLGLHMLKEFIYDGDFVWEDGEIYDPKSGTTYSCKMTLMEDNKTLEVRGYVGLSLFGKTQEWTRSEL